MFRALACLAGVLAFAACTPDAAQKSVIFNESSVIVQAPTGYCIDGPASIPSSGFAVIAPCASLGGTQAMPSAAAVATIQIGAAESGAVDGSEATLRDFLESDAGATLLSSSGDSSTISAVEAQAADGRVIVHFNDSAPHRLQGLQTQEWRAFKDVNGRLVTVALRGLASVPLDDSTGIWLLNAMTTAVKPVVFESAAQTSEP
ncbi:dihydroxy-acid dehydratase [Loktanella sp. D2R18]|uniref:dihydroxy-acid dehydratase n=1 Tax=Rhodobacterales TaxID=204455 RepID=UPI000DEA99CF|nr:MULTISPECIES: dihydroxy-acid dehydratase [Rhodobacterales]MDO6590901.1 dihydroxy-acid dehydratase [Yoonia sp. 1_MG-2023]RBW43318.1 dihydroxy-acid dehydratase [Loktanella sp. D2R18]